MDKLLFYTKILLITVALIEINADSSLDWSGIFGEGVDNSFSDDRAVRFDGANNNRYDPFEDHVSTSNVAFNSAERLSKDNPVSAEAKSFRRRSLWFFYLRRRKPPYYLNPKNPKRRNPIRKPRRNLYNT